MYTGPTVQLTQEQKTRQFSTFEQLLSAGVDPGHVAKLLESYIDSLTELVAGPLIPENAELTHAYIQSADEYLKALRTKFLLN